MRNLRNTAFRQVALPEGLPLSAKAWDTNSDAIVCAFGPTKDQPFIELRRKQLDAADFQTIVSWDAPCPLPELESDNVLLLQYFADIATACLVLAGGDIVVVREEPLPGQERIEIVGSVDVGIAAAAWAPDEELLALVTRADALVLMSRDFEPVTESTLSADDLKASKHVSVGWGKKETQFQGKRAKAMRDPTMPESIDEGKPSPSDDGRTTVSWRGDGQYFAVNSIVPSHRRVIRVFTREAVLDSASEPVDGLESCLSWRPYGNLLAGIKRSSDKVEVIFFERNGLRHGEFNLRLSVTDMETWASNISLSWNIDSTVLAVGYCDRVQLWTMGNYHYYLKQEITLSHNLPGSVLSALTPLWHPETPLRLQVSNEDSHLDLAYNFRVNRGSAIPGSDYGIVAVIDGKSLKLTPLRQAGVPPPMSYCNVSFESPVIDCSVSADGQWTAVLTKETLELCDWAPLSVNDSTKTTPGRRFGTTLSRHSLQLPRSNTADHPLTLTQIEFSGDGVFVLAPVGSDSSPGLYRTDWAVGNSSSGFEKVELRMSPDNLVVDTHKNVLLAVERSKGDLVGSSEGRKTGVMAPVTIDNLQPEATLFTVNTTTESEVEQDLGDAHESYHAVSLSGKGTLKVDATILARDCSSFVVTDAHIIFTTTQHLLKFVHLTEPEKMEVPGNTPEVDERCRSIERGAKIVTVMPSTYAVVLQMPRGNIETIHPRVLVLSGIRNHINNLDYRSAFLACQNQQVDMNILHDYQPDSFRASIPKFIGQLKKPSRIDEFLSKLKEEDVTESLYRDTLSPGQSQRQVNGDQRTTSKTSNKVNAICDAFIAALSALTSNSGYIQNIITAHVCKRPPDLASALTLISSIHATSPSEADLAISHLCFLTDTTRLYNAALSLYSLELALLVAQNAQRDPREYMPFLQSLHAMEPLRRQYTIDNHLRNYSKALTSLHALDDHPAVEAYTLKHSLYAQALDLYKYSPDYNSAITRHYAAHLASTNQPYRAATLYDSLSDHTAAYPLYALAHAWREALTSGTLVPLPSSQLQTLAHSLATTLTDETRDYRAAAHIHEHYLSSPLEAARLLCRGSYIADAILLLSRTSPSSIPETIDPALSEQTGAILSLLADFRSQLSAQVPRITELRAIKAADPLAFYGGDASAAAAAADGVDLIPDNVSLAPTETTVQNSLFTRAGAGASRFGGTALSGASRKTSKTKRKEERKRARGKKGSVYEEEYLVASVGRLVERWNGTHDEVKRLLAGLARRGKREEGVEVQRVMGEVGDAFVKAKTEVWGFEEEKGGAETAEGNAGELGRSRPNGADGVLWDSQQEGGEPKMKKAPEVKAWTGGEVFA
ncbi:uncharacterized protein HMPREF1541_00434 [Cyphellophora europaea CBS 101466]|uniref:Elongator complex protein 1 n=1 Tax=Cyphellophora europaea (strain CBS 101466) TaxID=1220924 RepID=W2SCB6_CYPE1|nr:uncharacterized protein HMPREF1541_00434 [Cyphellophora europaea CBS 101466]ETN46250.1 hypothetical protein HMPREF1541_00434 [Cyphellophora europaea CBS 101466]